MQKHGQDICCLRLGVSRQTKTRNEISTEKSNFGINTRSGGTIDISQRLLHKCVQTFVHLDLSVIIARFQRAKERGVKKGNARHSFWSLLALPVPLETLWAGKYCETQNWLSRFQTLHLKRKYPHTGTTLSAHGIPPATQNEQSCKTILASRTGNRASEGNGTSSKTNCALSQTTATSSLASKFSLWPNLTFTHI